jgi:hypothetical protein
MEPETVFSSLFPTWYKARMPEPKQEEFIFYNWLNVEVDEDHLFKIPTIFNLTGWRNKEVYEFVRGPGSKDWTVGISA